MKDVSKLHFRVKPDPLTIICPCHWNHLLNKLHHNLQFYMMSLKKYPVENNFTIIFLSMNEKSILISVEQ